MDAWQRVWLLLWMKEGKGMKEGGEEAKGAATPAHAQISCIAHADNSMDRRLPCKLTP